MVQVPGFNSEDLSGQVLDLPENCQDFLKTVGETNMEELISCLARQPANLHAANVDCLRGYCFR